MFSPDTNNPLLTNYFQFKLDKVPNIVYFCQSVNLPGIRFGEFDQPTIFSHPVRSPVGAVRFNDLELSFKVDEDLKNWEEIQVWIKEMSHYVDSSTIKQWHTQRYNGTLSLTNSVYKPKIQVEFKYLFPIELSGIVFSTNSPDSTEAIATVKFGYSDYDIKRIPSDQ